MIPAAKWVSDAFTFDHGDDWTVELILQTGGNLRTHSIPRTKF
jgi:hypothetical protein